MMRHQAVVFMSHTAFGGPINVGSHHYAREAARASEAAVHHIATPISPAHMLKQHRPGGNTQIARSLGKRAYVDDAGVHHLTPVAAAPVGRLPAPLEAVNAKIVHRQIRRQVRARPLVVILDQPLMWRCAVESAPDLLIYRPTDTASSSTVAECEKALAPHVAAVVATNEVVLSHLPIEFGSKPHLLLPNGVDATHISSGVDIHVGPRSGVVYVGAIDERFDWRQVVAWATAWCDIAFDLYGPVLSPSPVPLPPNVHVRGALKYELLPAVLASHRVGIIPLSDAEWNAGRSPMKLYEYLSAGLNVVSSSIAAVAGSSLPGVDTFASKSEAGAALAGALCRGVNTAGVERAAREDWRVKATLLMEFISHVAARAGSHGD